MPTESPMPEATPLIDPELVMQIARNTATIDLVVRVFLYLLLVGFCGFVAWQIWSKLLFPYIKTFIKFPL